jgi:HAD superfamily hydrolase (TIGR01549 family)
MKKIEAILFDFGGTLDYDGVDWFTRLFRILQPTHRFATQKEFDTYADQAAQAICFMEDTPTLSMAETVGRICEQIQARSHTHNGHDSFAWDPKQVSETFVSESRRYLERNRQVLAQLHKTFRLGVISNNWGNTAGWCRQCLLHEYLDTMIDSTVVGSVKPDAGIFQAALRDMKLAPEQCVYVGDRYDCDVQGSRAAGMVPIWIVGERNHTPPDNSPEVLRISNLTRLLEIDFSRL